MVKNELETVLRLADTLNQRVIGQRHASDMIPRRIHISGAGLRFGACPSQLNHLRAGVDTFF